MGRGTPLSPLPSGEKTIFGNHRKRLRTSFAHFMICDLFLSFQGELLIECQEFISEKFRSGILAPIKQKVKVETKTEDRKEPDEADDEEEQFVGELIFVWKQLLSTLFAVRCLGLAVGCSGCKVKFSILFASFSFRRNNTETRQGVEITRSHPGVSNFRKAAFPYGHRRLKYQVGEICRKCGRFSQNVQGLPPPPFTF